MSSATTVIDAHADIEGTLKGKDAQILGRFRGTIELTGRLVLGEGARGAAQGGAGTVGGPGGRQGGGGPRGGRGRAQGRAQGPQPLRPGTRPSGRDDRRAAPGHARR